MLTKIKAFWQIIIKKNYQRAVDLVLPPILENPAVKPFLGKHKRVIGAAVAIFGALLQAGKQFYPEYAPILESVDAIYLIVAGLIYGAIGVAHADSKDRRNVKI